MLRRRPKLPVRGVYSVLGFVDSVRLALDFWLSVSFLLFASIGWKMGRSGKTAKGSTAWNMGVGLDYFPRGNSDIPPRLSVFRL